ncbi:MAG: hypothetical protein N2234_03560 [Planctomycetota bacterium]|nr:hypothetical protein [Planctomycetota bacterium]
MNVNRKRCRIRQSYSGGERKMGYRAVRAARGAKISCKGWHQEAAPSE